MTKLASILAAGVAVLALTAPAFATEHEGKTVETHATESKEKHDAVKKDAHKKHEEKKEEKHEEKAAH
ncbi:MAG: hypothetical protein ACKVOE_05340 [Rickettsiales bacterium]